MSGRTVRENLRRETTIGIVAGLVAALAPTLLDWHGTVASAVCPMPQVAASLGPKVFLNAMMSALVPAMLILRQHSRQRPLVVVLRSRLPRSVAVVLGLAVGATLIVMASLHIIADALALTSLPNADIIAVRATQAILVAASVTPASIIILSWE